jgi:hypothetical protein
MAVSTLMSHGNTNKQNKESLKKNILKKKKEKAKQI